MSVSEIHNSSLGVQQNEPWRHPQYYPDYLGTKGFHIWFYKPQLGFTAGFSLT